MAGLAHGAATKLLPGHAGNELAVAVAFDGWRSDIYHVTVADSHRGKGVGLALREEPEADLAARLAANASQVNLKALGSVLRDQNSR